MVMGREMTLTYHLCYCACCWSVVVLHLLPVRLFGCVAVVQHLCKSPHGQSQALALLWNCNRRGKAFRLIWL